MLNRPQLLLGVLVLLALLVWWQRPAPRAEVTRTALIMGTLVEIKGVGQDEDRIGRAIDQAFAEMRRQEEIFSPRIAESKVVQLNQSLQPIEAGPDLLAVFSLAEQVRKRTDGAFNEGLGRLKTLWGIESDHPHRPDPAEIANILFDPTAELVRIDQGRIERVEKKAQLDLGGIAKGYAVDRAIEVLRRAGLHSASINAGGDIRLLGAHGERPWRIGIQHPRHNEELLATIELRDRAIVTSGDYERYFMQDGERYHHIFDPRTGYPARGCQSVTVLAETAAEADALATAVFVLGPERGLKLLEQEEGVEGLIVAADGKISLSSGLKGRVEWP